ncbi:ImmA/IrrE family metallo-endopeptidase [Lysobacter gummosus]|uniref:ImmA/IrrE family metallo-endopeptidase n=1 Tax=Lysobacter gummosus TaxID=262324 RepID=UPI0036354F6C
MAGQDELADCAAFTVPEHKLVVLREDVYDGLFNDDVFSRSTVIHELSHIVLDHAVTLHRGAILGKHQFCEDSEWQAKALTAAIMMPLTACQAAHSPHELSQMCGTSYQAATYRIDRLVKEGKLDPARFAGGLFW